MTSSPCDDFTEGFTGPAIGQVDFTPVGVDRMQVEVRELQSRIVNYIHQRGSAAPASGKDAATSMVQKFVKFHHTYGNEVWGAYAGKSFVKGQLIGKRKEEP